MFCLSVQGSTAPDYYAPNITQPLPEADPSVCAPRGTLPPRPANVAKTPHRKNVNGGVSGNVQRNRTATTTHAPATVPALTTTTTTTTSRSASVTTGRPSLAAGSSGQVNNGQVASVWGQGASLNHEKAAAAPLPPSSVVIETPLNDVVHLHNHSAATQETTASQELSSRRASVMQNSAESTSPRLGSFTIILIALCCTYNSVWASSSCSRRISL